MMPEWVRPFRAVVPEDWVAATTETKALFLTTFDRFGEPFLLALDALDRGLLKRVSLSRSPVEDSAPSSSIYVAQGARHQAYEIRLGSLHCSCPRFAYMAFVEAPRDETHCKHLIAATLLEHGGTFFSSRCKEIDMDPRDFIR